MLKEISYGMKPKLILFTDGGSRNNPGAAGIGGVAFKASVEGHEVFRFKKFLGTKTNNQAEYLALIEGLSLALERGYQEIECFLDSELVVKQLNGLYKIKHSDLKPLAEEVNDLKTQFSRAVFIAIPRAKNKIADLLVNEAIDENLAI